MDSARDHSGRDKRPKKERSLSHTLRRQGQQACSNCHKFMCKGDDHVLCVKCSLEKGLLCSPSTPCPVCQNWTPDLWSKYREALTKVKDKALEGSRQLLRTLPSPVKQPVSAEQAIDSSASSSDEDYDPALESGEYCLSRVLSNSP